MIIGVVTIGEMKQQPGTNPTNEIQKLLDGQISQQSGIAVSKKPLLDEDPTAS